MKKSAVVFMMFVMAIGAFAQKVGTKAAEEVIRRFAGDEVKVQLALKKCKEGTDYEAVAKKGKVTVKGSTPVALCRGFYDLVKSSGSGIDSWSGKRFDAERFWAKEQVLRGHSPFVHHYYMNVVTYGYTTPYWDEERWDEEIDHMALHGIDMPLMLVAQEAIMKRTFKRIGLTDEEIDGYFAGPAHLPWMRMGNISNLEGPLTDNWHKDQVALAHHILDRERALGMTPICPAFAGFVPQAIQRLHPDAVITETSWCDGKFHNWMLSPDSPLFKQIGTLFIEEWQKEFGRCDYYIADSFNEMDLPFGEKGSQERHDRLAHYGRSVYESITASAPHAVWVMQGWMFGYQRDIWDKSSLQALVSQVPDEKMMLLDLAEDYNYTFWKIGNNWDFYDGFFGKQWVYSVIPNMGGKNALTGKLDFYANGGRLEVLGSKNRGNLTGYGMAPEGLESNELLHELIWDAGWTSGAIDTDAWLTQYQQCRYGRQLVANKCFADIYDWFTDHPRFFWQLRPGATWKGSVSKSSQVYNAWCKAADKQGSLNDLARADYAEIKVMALGRQAEFCFQKTDSLLTSGDSASALRYADKGFDLMRQMDELLTKDFPTRTLDHWLGYSRGHGATVDERQAHERDARRIVTVWGPPVDDYSARLWGGLIGGYYLPRWQLWLSLRLQGRSKSDIDAYLAKWEEKWIAKVK